MQNCTECYGKRWYAKIDNRTGLQLKNRDGQLLWRCFRCGHVQTEPKPQTILDRTIRTDASILYLDIEVSKSMYFNYGAKVPSKYLRPADLIHPYYIICWSASYLHDEKIWKGCVTPNDAKKWTDKGILKQIHELIKSADIIAGHNVDAFDIKKLNTRFLVNGLEPIVNKKSYDTLKIARSKLALESNKLDEILRLLGLRPKDDITDEDWQKIVRACDTKVLKKVMDYNINDVAGGKEVLRKFIPFSGKRKDYGSVTSKKIEDL
jgi:DNA polymerase elongation subunit (family B)